MKSIYIVIVLYKVALQDAVSYQTLIRSNQIEEFFVYDNSPEEFNQPTELLPKGVTYVRDFTNSGLSKAYNAGAKRARDLGYTHVLILDQDTRFEKKIWKSYIDHSEFPGIVAPTIRTVQGQDFSPVDIKGWSLKGVHNPKSGEYSLFDVAVVNSGCCIPLSLYEQAGGYNEAVRLDFADFQFQIRARVFQPRLQLLSSIALQDFSNDIKDVDVLLHRYQIYLECAAHFTVDSAKLKIKHHYQVFRHGLALMLRTHNIQFLTNYLKIFLLKSK